MPAAVGGADTGGGLAGLAKKFCLTGTSSMVRAEAWKPRCTWKEIKRLHPKASTMFYVPLCSLQHSARRLRRMQRIEASEYHHLVARFDRLHRLRRL